MNPLLSSLPQSPLLVETLSGPHLYMENQSLISSLLTPPFAHRRKQRVKNALAKAMGLKKAHYNPLILDATGGFGVDSCLLADLGYTVLILERNPLIARLLQKTLPLLRPPLKQPIFVLQKDSIEYLQNQVHSMSTAPQIIYLDPMFPERKKTALNKGSLRFLKTIVGKDPDARELFNLAYLVAKDRVVVKRPRHAPLIAEKKPSYSMEGKSSRYDIYLTKKN